MVSRVMITAAASGIGRSIARAFAREGAKVHVCDIDEAALDGFRAPAQGRARDNDLNGCHGCSPHRDRQGARP